MARGSPKGFSLPLGPGEGTAGAYWPVPALASPEGTPALCGQLSGGLQPSTGRRRPWCLTTLVLLRTGPSQDLTTSLW